MKNSLFDLFLGNLDVPDAVGGLIVEAVCSLGELFELVGIKLSIIPQLIDLFSQHLYFAAHGCPFLF